MNNSVSAIGIAAMLALTVTGCTTGSEPRGLTDERMRVKVSNRERLAMLGGPTCRPPTVCEVVVTRATVNDNPALEVCVAIAPEVKIYFARNQTKQTVVWKLRVDNLGGSPPSFREKDGLIFQKQSHNQHVGKHKRGDGTTGNDDPDKYNAEVNRRIKDDASDYLPVVLWGAPGAEILCAAVDPKIVNEN